MREILFRGKSVQTDEWVTGSLIIDENNRYYIGRAVTPKVPVSFGMPSRRNGKTLERFIGIGFVMVIPETVGQYTGLSDKNGTKIFEGDIVKFGNIIGIINYSTGCYCVKTNKPDWRSRNNPAIDIVINEYPNEIEIIGNVHDNPGLLKGADDESV